MSFNYHCISCNINSVIRIINLLKPGREQSEQIIRDVLKYLSTADYKKSNPEITSDILEIICKSTGDSDPYRDIKEYCNRELLKMHDELSLIINSSPGKFTAALKMAIAGNLIDFSAKYSFNMQEAKQKIIESSAMKLEIDHSNELHEKLKYAKSLLYLGDNCGEIVLDKLFIGHIKNEFPCLKVYFGVRGKPVSNDVTFIDAEMTGMNDVAEIIENGDGSSGTVLDRVSGPFREIFNNADVIISKGQGNYESLASAPGENIFFLFMAKCELVAEALGVGTMAILCIKNAPPGGRASFNTHQV